MDAWITPYGLLLYLSSGVIAGLLGGLMGLGGGIVIVPALLLVFAAQGFPGHILMHMAVATSLGSAIFTALSSTYAHHKRKAVRWNLVVRLTPGIAVGAVLGGFIANRLSSSLLQGVFGVFVLIIATQTWFGVRPTLMQDVAKHDVNPMAGAVIGSISAILGIAGGSLTVPYLLTCRVDMKSAVATSAACGFFIALAGAATMGWAGWSRPVLPAGSLGYVFVPAVLTIALASTLLAPVGARIAHALPMHILQRVFSVFLVCIAIRMLVQD